MPLALLGPSSVRVSLTGGHFERVTSPSTRRTQRKYLESSHNETKNNVAANMALNSVCICCLSTHSFTNLFHRPVFQRVGLMLFLKEKEKKRQDSSKNKLVIKNAYP